MSESASAVCSLPVEARTLKEQRRQMMEPRVTLDMKWSSGHERLQDSVGQVIARFSHAPILGPIDLDAVEHTRQLVIRALA